MSFILFKRSRASAYADLRDAIRVKCSIKIKSNNVKLRKTSFVIYPDLAKYLKIQAKDKVAIYYDDKNPLIWKIRKTGGVDGYKLFASGTKKDCAITFSINSSSEYFSSFDSCKKFTIVKHEKKGNGIIINLEGEL